MLPTTKPKRIMKRKEITLYTNVNHGYTYADYVDFCDANNITPLEEESSEYYNWLADTLDIDLCDLMTNLRYSKYNDYTCMVTGSLGLWTGRHEIADTYMPSLAEAISRCKYNCDYVTITLRGNTIDIDATHHDGTNRFSIYLLTDTGDARYHRHGKVSLANKENVLALPSYLW